MHVYALELQTNRVWDYMEDRYVHRLAHKSDGKLVELPHPENLDPSTLPDMVIFRRMFELKLLEQGRIH